MSASVEQLDRELVEQAGALQRALAQEQDRAFTATVAMEAAVADLAGVREELGEARAELQWLRRAGIDLNVLMERPVVRGLRTAAVGTGRLARRARGRRT